MTSAELDKLTDATASAAAVEALRLAYGDDAVFGPHAAKCRAALAPFEEEP